MSERKKMVTAEEIEEAALELPRRELDGLIERLIARLDTPESIQAAWDAEIARRIAEVETGEVVPIPYEEARARWRAQLG